MGPLSFYVPLEIFFCPFPEYFFFQDFSLLMPQFLFPLIIAIIIPVYRSKILTTRTKKNLHSKNPAAPDKGWLASRALTLW